MIILSDTIEHKLRIKHGLSDPLAEIEQAFMNREGRLLTDTREEHQSDPPTQWFIAETHFGRLLKVCFILKDGNVYIRTAYYANHEEIRIYNKYK